jgi:O-antigen/teichoic acid export membrane protein
LVLNTGSNGLLGVAFWVVAARLYDQETIATNTALIAAMTTLSGISQLNLGPGLAVLLPRAGSSARRVLLSVYGAVTAFSILVLTAFSLLVLPLLDNLSATLDSGQRALVFAVAVLAFNLFALQDAALVALRRGKFVPVENAAFGVSKTVLVAVFSAALPALGVFVSWLVPMLVLVPVVSTLLLRSTRTGPPVAVAPEREPIRRLALDYAGYLVQVSSTVFLPEVALELLEPSGAALFAVAWLTSSTLDLLATNIGTALTVETSYGEDPDALRRTTVRRALPLVAGVSVAGLLAAPLVLHIYGGEYAEHGTLTLQVLLLASVPRSLVTFAVAEARAQSWLGVIVSLRAQKAALVLGLSMLLAPRMGVEGMAVAWLSAQLAGAASAWLQVFRRDPVPEGGPR